VSRIDAASGDRNLVCSCTPLEEYARAQEAQQHRDEQKVGQHV